MYIVERVLFKGFNCAYRRTCTVQSVSWCISSILYCSKDLIVYIVELALFKGFNGVYRRTCTVQKV